MLRFQTHKFLLGAFVSSATAALLTTRPPHTGHAAANASSGSRHTRAASPEMTFLFDVLIERAERERRLTTQAQRRPPSILRSRATAEDGQDAPIATTIPIPSRDSLQRIVRSLSFHVLSSNKLLPTQCSKRRKSWRRQPCAPSRRQRP